MKLAFKPYSFFLLLFLVTIFGTLYLVPSSFALDAEGVVDATAKYIDIGDSNRTMINIALNLGAPKMGQDCRPYPGFINKIVMCVGHMVTQEDILLRLMKINTAFLVVSNVMIMIYIMNFGMKLAFMQIQNVRSEILVVLLTVSVISYVNNSVRILDYIRFFIGFQNEFANAATTAIKTRPLKYGEDVGDNAICFSYKDDNGATQNYTIWQRADCLVAYVIGMHPVVEKMQQFYSADGQNGVGTYNNKKFDYGLFAGKENPFANMATDGYEMLRGLDVKDVINDPSKAATDYFTKPRPVANNKAEVFVSFSMVIITIGMLFSHSPAFGMMALMTGVFIVILLIAAFGQAALVYITSLFAVLFLGMIAPIMIPMFLFKQTRQMFEIWLQQIFTFTIQPGIMLVYLSFMIFVLQYVVTYSSCSPSNPDSCEVESLKRMNFGKSFTQAINGREPLVDIVSRTTSRVSRERSGGDYVITVADADVRPSVTTDIGGGTTSLIGNEQNSLSWVQASKTTVDQGNSTQTLGDQSGYTIKKSGAMNQPLITVPTHEPATEVSGLMEKFFANRDSISGDLDQSIRKFQEEGTDYATDLGYIAFLGSLMTPPREPYSSWGLSLTPPTKPTVLAEKIHEYQSQQSFLKNNNYLQSMMVVFLTLAITFSFMSNVMTIGGSIAGAGSNPMSRMINLYELQASKLSNFIKS